MIGIDSNRFILYEGETYYGHAVWPTPILLRARLPGRLDHAQSTSTSNAQLTRIFREDVFDPLTRIRRGRLYAPLEGVQPAEWRVQPHPAYPQEYGRLDASGFFVRPLHTYLPCRELACSDRNGIGATLLLGDGRGVMPWQVIGLESGLNGEDIVTLRARSYFGRLVELNEAVIPSECAGVVKEAVSALADRALRESPISIIDRCGNTAQIILSRWLAATQQDSSCLRKDLSAIANHLENRYGERVVLAASAKILARLHARGKPNEQLDKSLRVPSEVDAENALSLISAVLLEIGWGQAAQ